MQCYAPTETFEPTENEFVYSHLNKVLSELPHGDIVKHKGDFNAQLAGRKKLWNGML